MDNAVQVKLARALRVFSYCCHNPHLIDNSKINFRRIRCGVVSLSLPPTLFTHAHNFNINSNVETILQSLPRVHHLLLSISRLELLENCQQ
jgi:hypothetical protein